MKVVLVIANISWYGKRPWRNFVTAAPIITTILKDKFDFSILDANVNNYTIEEAKNKLEETKADVVLITALSSEYFKAYHTVAEIAKKALPKCKVIMGGVYPTVSPEEVVKDCNIDYVMMGHAENRLDYLMHMLEENRYEDIENFVGMAFRKGDQIRINPIKEHIGDVKEMVKPDYSFMDIDKYLDFEGKNVSNFSNEGQGRAVSLMTSYGCPYNCLFCATRTISGRKIAWRPLEDVFEELDYFIKTKNTKCVTFMDDNMLADRERAVNLLQGIIQKNYGIEFIMGNVAAWHLDEELLYLMKRAGFSRISISVESGNERVLHKIVRKPLKLDIVPNLVKISRELDLLMTANFIIGFPGETWEEIRETLRFAEKCDFDLVNIHIATVLPKTDLYELAVETKSIPENFSFYKDDVNFGFGKGNITTDEFTPGELAVIRAYEWDRINFSNEEKKKRACRIMGITLEQLKEHRKQTRIHCGIYFN